MAGMRRFKCYGCNHEWEIAYGLGRPNECPQCKNTNIHRADKGTNTEKNLLAAFAGESQARNRYTYFASAAKKEGYEQIANIFTETAENEKEHAKVFFKYLEGGDVEITASYPAGMIKDTKTNLEEATAGENLE